MIRLSLFLLSFLTLATLDAQKTHTDLALQAYLSADAATWNQAIAAATEIADEKVRLQTLMAYHQQAIGSAMGRQDEAGIDTHIEALEEVIDAYWELDENNAAAHGHYSALLGFKIARKPMSAMMYGRRASSYAKSAYELDATDPVAVLSIASNLFYTPERWGGDRAKALDYVNKAVANLPAGWEHNMYVVDLLVMQGELLAAVGDTAGALESYERVLAVHPNHGYVGKYLLPKLDSKK